jgi:protein ImuA
MSALASSSAASTSSSAASPSLVDLLARSDIWTGARLASQGETLPSGFHELDAELPGGGWPRGALIDVLQQAKGIGELALLLPALAQLTERDEWVLLLAPPWHPFAPAWRAAGLVLSRLIVVDAPPGRLDKRAADDCLWAAEQVLRAGSVSAALMWLPAKAESAQLRRLQLAAEAGGSSGFFLQDERRLNAASPAPLRLHLLSPANEALGQLAVRIIKRRGPPLAKSLQLALPRPWLRERGRFATSPPADVTNVASRPPHEVFFASSSAASPAANAEFPTNSPTNAETSAGPLLFSLSR